MARSGSRTSAGHELRIHVTKPVEGTPSSPFARPEDEMVPLTREVVVTEGSDPLDLGI
jgi:hypothetical protein